jgi:3-hydroxyacyl-[acyl-carrier-protein] dehydratase
VTAPARPRSATTTVRIDPADPVFAGHYPGFPILPGLFLVEYVHRAVLAGSAGRPLRATALERVRFRRPVRPGDLVQLVLSRSDEGADLVFAAEATVAGEQVATLRLRYSEEGAR